MSLVYMYALALTSGAGATTSPDHDWDFRDCSASSGVVDSQDANYTASIYGGATCGSDGLLLDGESGSYAQITPTYEFGGSMSIETYATWDALNDWAPIMYFADGAWSNEVALTTYSTSGRMNINTQGGSHVIPSDTVATTSAWLHIVVTLDVDDSDGTCQAKFYFDGSYLESAEGESISAPVTTTRANHYVGYGDFGSPFEGTIGYLRIWHGTVLSASDAASLYDDATATPGPTTGPSPTPTTAPSTPEPTTPVPSPAPTALPTWVKESSFPLPLKYHVQRGAGGLSRNDGGLEARMEDGCYGTQAADYDEGKCGPPGSGYAQNSAYGTGTNCNDGFGKCNTDSD